MMKQHYIIQRTRVMPAALPDGSRSYVEYLTEPRNGLPEFRRPGTSRLGVGVDNLKIWRTKAGAERWMSDRPGWREAVSKVGAVEVVPA